MGCLGQAFSTKTDWGARFQRHEGLQPSSLVQTRWQLLDQPDKLCSRLLKARYFPNDSLVDMVFTGNASAIGKGIEHGLQLLKKGLI